MCQDQSVESAKNTCQKLLTGTYHLKLMFNVFLVMKPYTFTFYFVIDTEMTNAPCVTRIFAHQSSFHVGTLCVILKKGSSASTYYMNCTAPNVHCAKHKFQRKSHRMRKHSKAFHLYRDKLFLNNLFTFLLFK